MEEKTITATIVAPWGEILKVEGPAASVKEVEEVAFDAWSDPDAPKDILPIPCDCKVVR
jgi:hypothetical protein